MKREGPWKMLYSPRIPGSARKGKGQRKKKSIGEGTIPTKTGKKELSALARFEPKPRGEEKMEGGKKKSKKTKVD